jgi:hypothetical protein
MMLYRLFYTEKFNDHEQYSSTNIILNLQCYIRVAVSRSALPMPDPDQRDKVNFGSGSYTLLQKAGIRIETAQRRRLSVSKTAQRLAVRSKGCLSRPRRAKKGDGQHDKIRQRRHQLEQKNISTTNYDHSELGREHS